MKKIILSGVLAAAAAGSMAAPASGIASLPGGTQNLSVNVCIAANNGGGKATVYGGAGSVFPTTAPTAFVQQGFDVQCSSNTEVTFKEASATLAGVLSTSKKGNQVYGGASNGGEVRAVAKCATDPCAASDLSAANWTLVATDFNF